MYKTYFDQIISLAIIPISVFSVQRFSSMPIGSTTIWWLVEAMILIIYFRGRYLYLDAESKRVSKVLMYYLIWNAFSLVRGMFIAETYWDWKGLVGNIFILLFPAVAYTFSNKDRVQETMSAYVKYALPLSLFILPFLSMGSWGWYLFPMSFLILFFPILKFYWKILIIVISMIVVFSDISVRSYIFKFGLPVVLLVFYYLRFVPALIKVIRTAHWVLLLAPWILFFLAVSGVFNVFKIDEYTKGLETKNTEVDQPLNTDSRSFLYEEVLHSADKYDYYWLGRSPARGNETVSFASISDITGRKERLRNEANILNVFTWTGIIGVLLFFLVFFRASWLAINRSNNIYSRLLGLFVAFRWAYSWVEDYYEFDLNTLVIWMMIGLCFSHGFRKMSNGDVKLWARGIFEKKYLKAYKKYVPD